MALAKVEGTEEIKLAGSVRSPQVVIEEATLWANALMGIVNKQQMYQQIEDKKYLEVEAWQLIGAFDGVHALLEWTKPIERDGKMVGYLARVVLYKRGEVVGSGELSCGLDEFPCRGKEGEAKHKAARSAAQTWAESKAFRLKYAYVARLAGYEATPVDEVSVESESCPTHNVPWQKFSKGKQSWFSHKTEDGKWCNRSRVEDEGKSVASTATSPDNIQSDVKGSSAKLPEGKPEYTKYFEVAKGKYGLEPIAALEKLGFNDWREFEKLGGNLKVALERLEKAMMQASTSPKPET